MSYKDVEWVELTQDMVWLLAFVKAVMKLRVQ
jgi:hypothetical protein